MLRNSLSLLLNRLLGGEGEIVPRQRYQEPTVGQTDKGVWFFRPRIDVIKDGKVERVRTTVSIGAGIGKREAVAAMRKKMEEINSSSRVLTSQVRMKALLAEYEKIHIAGTLGFAAQKKYRGHIGKHIVPAFEDMMLCDITTLLVQKWIDAKGDAPENLGWHTRTDIRNILSSLFTEAKKWGLWTERNPVEDVHVHVREGKEQLVYEKRKLSYEQISRLLAMLPYVLRVQCGACLGTLRFSEAAGLMEKHLNFDRGVMEVRQRFYRGNLAKAKNRRAARDVPMGHLAADLKRLCMGDPERYVFQLETAPDWGRKTAICQDDRQLHQHFLKPAAVELGIYYKGFGFRTFRREAITALGPMLGGEQVRKISGHGTSEMTFLYTLDDFKIQDAGVRAFQERILGEALGKLQ
jgi:integrase